MPILLNELQKVAQFIIQGKGKHGGPFRFTLPALSSTVGIPVSRCHKLVDFIDRTVGFGKMNFTLTGKNYVVFSTSLKILKMLPFSR